MVSQGSNGKELMERIRAIGLQPFDYKQEYDKTVAKLTEAYEKEVETYYPPMALDGHSYEIIFHLGDTELKLRAANPGWPIQEFSEHNERFGELYSVYKKLMLYYSERKFHFK